MKLYSFILILLASACTSAYSQTDTTIVSLKLKDGLFTGSSQGGYIAEPYWGIVKLSVKDGLITDVSFMIRDSALHETFNDAYAKHFAGNEVYIQQTKNDWNGVKTYPVKLREKQDISKVDVISGATWSYNIFRASLDSALSGDH
ncbi:MAG TPA: FMN-binding protein [Bacteroidales bacterium]|nr:FMN-binding protein [Bacteroidales bacterium]